jgi:light-regulated signal transduction histidine kinase (bacteriophytochrome)
VGRLREDHTAVDCNELVRRAEVVLAPRIEETGAVVEAGNLPVVSGEASLLALVFQNLIGNGLKFRGEEPPHITVGAERDGDEWRFTVADNGIGVDREYADRIFIIFQRLHPRTSYEGTGIGLSMVRKIIEYHGGRVWLDTERDHGATFHFTLPVIDDTEEAPAAP